MLRKQGLINPVIAMQLIPKEEEKVSPAELRLKKLVSGDSDLLDLLLFCYIECQEEIIQEEILKESHPEKKLVLKGILEYIQQAKALMLFNKDVLFGNCHLFADVISYAKEISKLSRNKKSPHERDDYEQLLRDFEKMRTWDRTREGLRVRTAPEQQDAAADAKQKSLPGETLGHVFERVFSYVFQKHAGFIKLLKLKHAASWKVEITGSSGKIISSHENKIFRAVFHCGNPAELAKILSIFPALLPASQQQIILQLMPYYKNQYKEVILDNNGHSLSVSADESFIYIDDQQLHGQFSHGDYASIAHAIFGARDKLYIKEYGAIGLFFRIEEYCPFIAVDAKEIGASEQKKSARKIPSSLDLLNYKPLDKNQLGALWWLALTNRDEDLFCHVSLQDFNVNVKNKAFSFSTPLMKMAETGNVEFAKHLLNGGALAFLVNDDGDTAFTLAEKNGHLKIVDSLIVDLLTDKYARLLDSMISSMVNKMKEGIYPTPDNIKKIEDFLNKNIWQYKHHYYLKVIHTKIFITHLRKAADFKNLQIAVDMTRVFKLPTIHYGYFFHYYINRFPPKEQYTVLNSLLAMFGDDKKATDTIRFFVFQYGLRHNHFLCDAMFADDHAVLMLADAHGKTISEIAKSMDEAAVSKKIEEMEAIAHEARQLIALADAKSLPSSQPPLKTPSAASMYGRGVFFAPDAKEEAENVLRVAPALPPAEVIPPLLVTEESGFEAEGAESGENLDM